jgi:hypothetical protein
MNKAGHVEQEKPDFASLLAGNFRIRLMPDMSFRVLLHKFADEPFVAFTKEQLSLTDERIPEVLLNMYDTGSAIRNTVPTEWLRNTLTYMDNPVALKDVFCHVYALKEISSVSWFDNDRSNVTISIVHYDYHRLKPLPYLTVTAETYITVATRELEKHYPGWLVRYDLLNVLDADAKTLKPEVFSGKPVIDGSAKESLTNVTFD